jgi:tetratricopeptide (TPR) repeat protein
MGHAMAGALQSCPGDGQPRAEPTVMTVDTATSPTAQSGASDGHPGNSEPRHGPSDRIVLFAAILLCGLAYSNAIRGGWVYDDQLQIVDNGLIQDPALYGKALASDVWAYHGDRGQAWSNYWRPMFTAWLIINFRLFGLNPVGWHVTSILGHMAVTVLVFRVLQALRLPRTVCIMVTLVFAVHPLHTESVAWVSGVTDVLMALFLLWAYLVHLRGGLGAAFAAPLLYFLALLSKEVAVFFPVVVFATDWIQPREENSSRRAVLRSALVRSLPFAGVAIGFVLLRYHVLGQMRGTGPGAPGFVGMLTTIPSILVFYLRQAFDPLILGPAHPLRPVVAPNIGLSNFAVPAAFLLVVALIAAQAWRSGAAYRLGIIWFLAPLALVLDTRVFLPDQIVNNRYLYLPVMGAWLIACTAIDAALGGLTKLGRRNTSNAAYLVILAICGALIMLTRDYNQAWGDEIALWERGVQTDPRSAKAYAELGEAYRKAERLEDAKSALSRAIRLDPDTVWPKVGLGLIALDESRYDEAEARLKEAARLHPDRDVVVAVVVEHLGLCYQLQNRVDDAIVIFRRGAERLPYNRAVYTRNIAILHTMAGRKGEAVAALESIRPELERSRVPAVLMAWLNLGDLYRDAGKTGEAIACYERFITQTEGMSAPELGSARLRCMEALTALKGK